MHLGNPLPTTRQTSHALVERAKKLCETAADNRRVSEELMREIRRTEIEEHNADYC
jgi:hypothetical protein